EAEQTHLAGGDSRAAKVPEDKQQMYWNHRFEDEVARFANGALSYYDDLGSDSAVPQTSAVQDAYDAFRRVLVGFEVDEIEDCQLAKLLDAERRDGVEPDVQELRKQISPFLRAGTMSDPNDYSA